MSQFNPAIDEYISKSGDFAKPILNYWRKMIHNTCPDVKEAIKWGIPHFDYRGDFMCVMAAYKSHCSFSFLKAELMQDPRLKAGKTLKPTQRFLGKINKYAQLPPEEEFIPLIVEAMDLNERGIKVTVVKSAQPKVLVVPDYFLEQLSAQPVAKTVFDARSDAFRKEYILWITEAKTELTRQKRMEEALNWIAEGKSRFWKYAR